MTDAIRRAGNVQAHIAGLEEEVLRLFAPAWCSSFGPTETFYGFRFIQRETGIPAHIVPGLLRHMTDKGLCRFQRGLFSEDGEVAGSGYGLTAKGYQLAREMFGDLT